jgi:ABC-type lipoprotein export system ATPase subunit
VHLVLGVLSAAVRSGTLVLVATHDQRVFDVADGVAGMRSGRVVTSS